MADEPRKILRLNTCPQCKYDLSGLPVAHNCPECGFTYSEDFFDVRGSSWASRKGFRSKSFLFIIGICFAIVFAIWRFGLFNYGELLKALLSLAFISGLVLYVRSIIQKPPLIQKTFTNEGILVKYDNELLVCNWSEVQSFSLTKTTQGYWRLKIQSLAPSIRQTIKKERVYARVDMKLGCTDNEAEAIRDEIQLRINLARSQEAQEATKARGENPREW